MARPTFALIIPLSGPGGGITDPGYGIEEGGPGVSPPIYNPAPGFPGHLPSVPPGFPVRPGQGLPWPGLPGHPGHLPAWGGRPVDPGWGVGDGGEVNPGPGEPGHLPWVPPGFPVRPGQGLPPSFPGRPGHGLPWPGRPVDPGFGNPEGAFGPDHPIWLPEGTPGLPDQLPSLPPGQVYPPLPPSQAGYKGFALVYIRGAGYRYVHFDIPPGKPDTGGPGGAAPAPHAR
jgi:hypothetical protein